MFILPAQTCTNNALRNANDFTQIWNIWGDNFTQVNSVGVEETGNQNNKQILKKALKSRLDNAILNKCFRLYLF